MGKITPFLWFDDNLQEAVEFYKTVFKNIAVSDVVPLPDGGFMSATFTIEGQEFMALNAGPLFKFNEAVSFFISCEDQAEVDDLWEKLCAGGGEGQCGWVRDKFGLWWQVIPKALGFYLGNEDREGASRAMQAMMGMKKIVVADLEKAFKGE